MVNTNRHPYFEPAREPEYVFRFPLDRKEGRVAVNLREMVAQHLRKLLDLLNLTWRGEEVKIDGFSLLSDPEAIFELYPEPKSGPKRETCDPLDIYEPRLGYVRHLAESLLDVVEFEFQGRRVAVDGFRLRRPDQWLSTVGGAADILAHAASRCNLNCRFCYNLGSPPAFRPAPRAPEEEYREILTRISHYVPASGVGLFPRMGGPCEFLLHPRIMDLLAALRRKTQETIRIPTNGSLLGVQTIKRLTEFRPLFLDVSLNSASPTRRRWLMRDPRPDTAIESMACLQAAGLPYSVVIVPWPFPSTRDMIDDLKDTVAFADKSDPAFFQISLPGYSRFFAERELFDSDKVWMKIKETVRALRGKTNSPLILRPGLYEEYQDPESVNDPRPIGVIKNSPADMAGLRAGDRILTLCGLAVKNRPQARSLLTLLHQSDRNRIPMTVQRQGGKVDLELEPSRFDYPYDPRTVGNLGIVFASSGLPPSWIENLRRVVVLRRASCVLLLTSRLIQPALEKMIREQAHFSNVVLYLRVPVNHYFGGNIFMGDLLVVEDFVRAVHDFLDERLGRPDLILLPSSPFHLSGWGRDLRGTVYKELERRVGIPVALVHCDPIFD